MSESEKIRKMLDYEIGDLVQVIHGENTGSLGQITNIRLSSHQKFLIYEVYIKDAGRTAFFRGDFIRFLSHQEKEVISEQTNY